MVQLFVAGQPIGAVPDPDGVIAGLAARQERAEVRDDAGQRLGTFTPDPPALRPLAAADVPGILAAAHSIGENPLFEDWVKAVEEYRRRKDADEDAAEAAAGG